MLTREGCRRRQGRMLKEMEENGWDLFLTSDYRTVYYFAGALGAAESPALFALWQGGTSALVASAQHGACADLVRPLESYSIQRPITHPFHDAAAQLKDLIARKRTPSRCAVERAGTLGLFEELLPNVSDATGTVLRLRKRKEDDEVAEIRQCLHYCAVAYRAAKETIAPGQTEIDVYNAMYGAVVREAGTAIAFPGDFACGERAIRGGGPPTLRKLLPGDLYILDLFPAPALYFGDACRTFAVGPPTEQQYRAWEIVREALSLGESVVKPGVLSSAVYRLMKEFLDSHELTENSFWHHAGHGIGHRGHEAPRIIPGSEDVFEVGDVIALEPGVYSKSLQGGIRLENDYVIAEGGLENLFEFPVEMS